MEEKNTPNPASEPKLFEIPGELINMFVKHISEKNKEKAIDLLKYHNNLKSQKELLETEIQIIQACRSEDLDLLKIILQEVIENDSKDLLFKIDKTNKTASLFQANQDHKDVIIIPRTIKHQNDDYLVTSICCIAPFSFMPNFNSKIKSLQFVEDSAVRTIYGHSFENSNIEELHIPKSLIELKDEWCESTYFLTKIIVSPLNNQFTYKDDKYLLEISIPPNIKKIGSYSFQYSNINKISIPSSVTEICKFAFNCCNNITKVEIPTNSNLQTIHQSAFAGSNVKEISIPASVTKICENAFAGCKKLTKVEIPTNSNLQTIENDVFNNAENLKKIFVPDSVTKICNRAFFGCWKLDVAEIPTNSNLQAIEAFAFFNSGIKQMYIPACVTNIAEKTFCSCSRLRVIEISEESKLQSIPESAFEGCKELILMIPVSLKSLIHAINNT